MRFQLDASGCDLALFNLAIDSKLRGCDLVALRLDDVFVEAHPRERTTIVRRKTGRPAQFEITEHSREALRTWLAAHQLRSGDYLFPSRLRSSGHLSTLQYARIVHAWVTSIGLDATSYGTHSLRRTKVAQIYRKTGNLRAVQLLLGPTKLGSTVRNLGIDAEDALSISEGIEL